MSLTQEQAKKYLEEAELSIIAAEGIFEKAKKEDKDLWANAVKACYDAIEQAISAGIAKKNEIIPKEHPAKIKKFTELYAVNKEIKNTIIYWLGKRSSAQYVDIKNNEITVPHELFTEEDAERAIEESKEAIEEIKKIIQ